MYQIAYIGRWETIPETAAAICDHDTPKLEALLQGGLDLDVPIQLSEYIKLMPLEIAVFRNDVPMIHFLLEHGANPDLAEEQPLLLTAARCCGPEVVSLFAGQAAKLSPKQKERAFQEVRWGQRAENIPVLEQAGITVAEFGGEAFRAAVSEGNTKLARLLLEKGADINYHKPDMVFPNASTAVTEAARHKNLPMVRWLIEQGADITIADKYGDRPYSVAVQNRNQEMADYLKGLEPEEWHNEQEKSPAAHALQAARPAGGILEDRPPALGVPGSEMGEVGGALLLHGCAGDDLETEEAALPYGGHGQLQRLSAAVEPQGQKAVVSGHRA